jgi:nitrite reductase/ring-hydroxylating ferredoxin subunit
MGEYESVLRTPELGPGQIREVRAHGRTLALVNYGQTYYAVDARCPGEGTNLAREGRLEGELLICPSDDSAFDVRSGERVSPEGGAGLRRYAIKVAGNAIMVGPQITDGNGRRH